MEETGAAKVSETEAVVWWQRKQRECLCGEYIGGGQWKQRGSGDGGKKPSAATEGTGAAVLAAATVAMALTDNSGNGRAGSGDRNRGSGGGNNNQPKRGSGKGKKGGHGGGWWLAVLKTEPAVAAKAVAVGMARPDNNQQRAAKTVAATIAVGKRR